VGLTQQVGELEGKVGELSGEVRSLKKGSSEQESARDSAMERLVKKAASDEVAKQGLTWEQGPNHYDPKCPCRGGCPCPAHGNGGEGARSEHAAAPAQPAEAAQAPVPAREAAPLQAAVQQAPRVAPVVAAAPAEIPKGAVPIAQLKALRLEVDTAITAEEEKTQAAKVVAPKPAPSAMAPPAAPAASIMAAAPSAVAAPHASSRGEQVAAASQSRGGGIPGGLRALVEEEVQKEVTAAVKKEEAAARKAALQEGRGGAARGGGGQEDANLGGAKQGGEGDGKQEVEGVGTVEKAPAEKKEEAVQPPVSVEDVPVERARQFGADRGEPSGAAAAQVQGSGLIDLGLVAAADFHSSHPQGHGPAQHEGCRESRRCSSDTYPESHLTILVCED